MSSSEHNCFKFDRLRLRLRLSQTDEVISLSETMIICCFPQNLYFKLKSFQITTDIISFPSQTMVTEVWATFQFTLETICTIQTHFLIMDISFFWNKKSSIQTDPLMHLPSCSLNWDSMFSLILRYTLVCLILYRSLKIISFQLRQLTYLFSRLLTEKSSLA